MSENRNISVPRDNNTFNDSKKDKNDSKNKSDSAVSKEIMETIKRGNMTKPDIAMLYSKFHNNEK